MIAVEKSNLAWLLLALAIPENLFAMHIMEGFLPVYWSITWFVVVIPFLVIGLRQVRKRVETNSKIKVLLGVAGAFMFALSALKLPSVTGSCSHPTGAGLGAILFGPFVMSVLGSIVLIFQALLLAHGGITTLGANVFSMAIAGPVVAIIVYRLFGFLNSPRWMAVFACAFLGDLATYVTTASQLALAFSSGPGGVSAAWVKFMGIFSFTQIPLAISEGVVTVLIFNFMLKHNGDELKILNLAGPGKKQS